MLGCFHFGSFFLFCAFVLIIIISVSAPVWNDLTFLKIYFGSGNDAGKLRLGMWGICTSYHDNNTCTSADLGYQIDDAINQAIPESTLGEISNSIIHGLTYALVLHPIAAGITLVALIFAVCNNVVSHIVGSLVALFAFLVQLVAFCIDLGIFATAHSRVEDALGGDAAEYGPALWISLVATVLLLLATFTVCFESNRKRRKRHARKDAERAERERQAAAPAGQSTETFSEKRSNLTNKLRFWNSSRTTANTANNA